MSIHRRMTPWTPTTRLLTTLLALATTTAVVFRARAITTMMMMTTVIDVFALLPDLIECKYLRRPIADACALVVNTLINKASSPNCETSTTLVSTGAPMTRRMTPWIPTTRLLTTLLALATTTVVVFRARAMTTMMMMTVIDVFALLPDLIECKYLRPPIADACALVVNTIINITVVAFIVAFIVASRHRRLLMENLWYKYLRRLRETVTAFSEGTGARGPAAVDPFIKQETLAATNSKSCSSAPAFSWCWCSSFYISPSDGS